MTAPRRRVRHLQLHAESQEDARRGFSLVEDALGTAALPGADDGRIVFVRRLELGVLPEDSSELAARIERLVSEIARVHAVVPTAFAAPAVWFRDAVEARVLLVERLARGESVDAWFWRLVEPEVPLSEGRAAVGRVLATVGRWGATAMQRALLDLVAGGSLPEVLDAVAVEDGPALRAASAAGRTSPAPALRPYAVAGAARWGRSDARVRWLVDMAGENPVEELDLSTESPAAPRAERSPDRRPPPPRPAIPGAVAPPPAPSATTPLRDPPFPPPAPPGGPGTGSIGRPAPSLTVPSRVVEAPRAPGDHRPFPQTAPIAPRRAALDFDPPSLVVEAGLHEVERPPLREALRDLAPVPPSEERPYAPLTAAAGLLFLLHLGCDRDALLAIANRLELAAEDPLLVALFELEGLGGARPPDLKNEADEEPIQCDIDATENRLLETLGETLAWLVVRPGRVAASRTHFDLWLLLDQADLAIRRAGLDVDPGWAPGLGRVVRFHYVDPWTYNALG